ncbi:very short patch repair endonuclease [Streptomyces sp. NPDC039022]|uniref:very short patch repair endonuclease n=1 Tax=Streptomyces sp. NPDC039022 TaxID=3157091 RepID=UPI0033E7F500
MSKQRSRDTAIEVAIRRELHAMGLRFRVHRRPLRGVRREADVVFGPAKVAIFVDGCFWHGCPEHMTWPKSNGQFWREKIEGNRQRDRDTDRRLTEAGWLPIRVWGHEDAFQAAERIRTAVTIRRSAGSKPSGTTVSFPPAPDAPMAKGPEKHIRPGSR